MPRRLFIVGLLFATLALGAIPTQAAHYKGSHDKSDHHSSLKHTFFKKASFFLLHQDELDLSEEQVDRIQQVKWDTKKALLKQQAEIDVLKVDIMAELKQDEVNQEAVNALIDQKYAIKSKKAKVTAQAITNLKAVLSEDQLKKAWQLWREKKRSGSHSKS